MLAEIFRTKQSLLLGCDRREIHAALRLCFDAGKCPRKLQNDPTSGRVVGGTVVNIVARLISMDSKMIVMRGVEDRLLAQLRIRAGDFANNVARRERPYVPH